MLQTNYLNIQILSIYFFSSTFYLELEMAQKRKGIVKQRHKPFFLEYSFEIKVIILFALGIFLLVEDLEIKHFIYSFIRLVMFAIGDAIIWLRNNILFLIKQFEVSDLVGISLIIYVLYLIADRWRERMIERFSKLTNCPQCGSNLNRIRKELKHKIMSFVYFLHVKHYHCTACSFKGIKLIK